jgi:hypothetical protein
MPDLDKLVAELIETRRQAQAVVERVNGALELMKALPADAGKEPTRDPYIIDFVTDLLKASGKPLSDAEIISSVKPEVERMGVMEPEIQTWKSLLFHIGPDKPLAAVMPDGEGFKECVFQKRTPVQRRKREFPGNAIALREWITAE